MPPFVLLQFVTYTQNKRQVKPVVGPAVYTHKSKADENAAPASRTRVDELKKNCHASTGTIRPMPLSAGEA
jgi:hypothetical protein